MNNILKLYHWTINEFSNFDNKYLWNYNKDLLSYIWFHFTNDRHLADSLFSYNSKENKLWYVLDIEYECINNYWTFNEHDLVINILEFAYKYNLWITKQFLSKSKKLPYIWNQWKNLISLLYNSWKRKNGINLKLIWDTFRQYLLNNNYNYIIYKNQLEWAADNRYDYILLDTNKIKIINN